MSQWVDIERLKSQVDVQQVLNYYSIEFVQQGDDLVCACPLPHHAGDRSSQTAFRFSLSKKIFNCLSHCGGGNIFDFVRLMENLPADKAGIRQTGLFMQ
jgi:DNA primase